MNLPPRHQDTKVHKELIYNDIFLVLLSAPAYRQEVCALVARKSILDLNKPLFFCFRW